MSRKRPPRRGPGGERQPGWGRQHRDEIGDHVCLGYTETAGADESDPEENLGGLQEGGVDDGELALALDVAHARQAEQGAQPIGRDALERAGGGRLAGLGLEFWALHPGGALFLFADGSVRFIKARRPPPIFQALATRAGGEILSEGSY
jgi:prepilin-type processing-associated H-X9-DG protein